jgi:hypothetical protein
MIQIMLSIASWLLMFGLFFALIDMLIFFAGLWSERIDKFILDSIAFKILIGATFIPLSISVFFLLFYGFSILIGM